MTDTAQSVAAIADRYFQEEGLNCAQAVLRAVAEAKGLMCPECIPAVALAIGGGLGHTGGVCGALTGGVMAIGLAVERLSPGSQAARKQAAYAMAGKLVHAFHEAFGATECCSILGFSWEAPDAMQRAVSENVKTVKCSPCVRWAAGNALRLIEET